MGFFGIYLVQKISDVPSWPTYQPTMSDFRPIMLNLPTYLKSDVINGRSLTQLCLIFLISTYSNAPLSQVPQNGLKGAAYLSAAVAKAVWEILPETLTVTRATVCHHSFAAMQSSSIRFQDLISSMNIRNLPQDRRKVWKFGVASDVGE